jgi:hypothetical protein
VLNLFSIFDLHTAWGNTDTTTDTKYISLHSAWKIRKILFFSNQQPRTNGIPYLSETPKTAVMTVTLSCSCLLTTMKGQNKCLAGTHTGQMSYVQTSR